MTKDLFLSTFNCFSRWSYPEFRANFIEQLPRRFINGAIATNPPIQSCTGFDDLFDCLSQTSGNRWKNPELYPHLNRLLIPDYRFVQRTIDALSIHVGLRNLVSWKETHPRFWRLREDKVEVVEITDKGADTVEDVVLCNNPSDPFPIIYRPYPSLFDDIESAVYRGDPVSMSSSELLSLTNQAIQLVHRYSPAIATRFQEIITTIAYMPNRLGWAKSFTKRNFYIGGVFISIRDPITVAEQFIHEYYHQCIWPWWMIEPPRDLPSDENMVVSPVTGRYKSISVMIHALLIYYSLVDFYRFVLSPAECLDQEPLDLEHARRRLNNIEAGIAPLLQTLQTALADHPLTLAFVNQISDFGCSLGST